MNKEEAVKFVTWAVTDNTVCLMIIRDYGSEGITLPCRCRIRTTPNGL